MKNLLNQWELRKKTDLQAGKVGYYVFTFLFPVLVACRPRFCLAVLASGAIKGRAIGGAVSAGREVAVGLLGLSL